MSQLYQFHSTIFVVSVVDVVIITSIVLRFAFTLSCRC